MQLKIEDMIDQGRVSAAVLGVPDGQPRKSFDDSWEKLRVL